MIRLGAMLVATMAGLVLAMSAFGTDNLRAERRTVSDPRPAVPYSGSGQAEIGESNSAEPLTAPPVVVQAESQTPQQVQRFPGPPLSPSPEHGGRQVPVTTTAMEGPVFYIAGDRVNVRAGPSTGDRVIAALDRGTAVQPIGLTDAEWVNIRDAQGRTGYIANRFLSAEAP